MSRVIVALLSVAFVVASAPGALAGPHDALIAQHAAANGVPEALVRRIIRIESRGNPGLSRAGNHGLMQIRLGTAKSMGYAGDANGLLDADTNLTYAVKYLAGAYRAAGCDADRAVRYYQRGYHGARQSKCPLLQMTDAQSKPVDVLKPRLVRIETIGAGGMVERPAGAFEPARISAQPAVIAIPMPRPAPTALQLASIPLPQARPELIEAPKKKEARAPQQESPKRVPANAKPTAEKKADDAADPTGVVAFVKKIVTPDTKPGKRAVADAAETPALSPAPPQ